MRIVNMHEAKTHLSSLVNEEFIIARAGKPVARVTPIDREPARLSAETVGIVSGSRLLLAQARVEGLVLLTGDARLLAYGFPTQSA